MTGYPTETQSVSLTTDVVDAVSDAVNMRASTISGVKLPPLVWVWCRGVYSLPYADQQEAEEFRGKVPADQHPEGTARYLAEWAEALRLTELTTETEVQHGRRTYTGLLAGSRIKISGRVELACTAA